MKVILTIISILILTVYNLQAQRITSSCTAEDAIRAIDQAAKSYLGKGPGRLTNISFDGKTFNETEGEYSYHHFITNLKITNWADYKETRVIKDHEEGTLFVILQFDKKKNNVQKESYDIVNDFIKDYKIKNENYLSFYMPLSEKGRVKDIETAASLLSKLARSGKLILPAETNKPSKEETVAFLNSTLKLAEGSWNDGLYLIISASFSETEITSALRFESGSTSQSSYSNIKWENFRGFDKDRSETGEDYIFSFAVDFTTAVKSTYTNKEGLKIDYPVRLFIAVPKDKIMSVQKAILHLAALSRE
jgi:hypothetical protein